MNSTLVHSLLTDFDISLFKAGKHFRLYEKLGAHLLTLNGQEGCYFAVYAPAAASVSVIGDFNFWDAAANPLNVRWDGSGIWEGFIPNVPHGTRYKFSIRSTIGNKVLEKADPFARFCEKPPRTASIVWKGDYDWKDSDWMAARKANNSLDAPQTVYELHAASWRWNAEERRSLTWLEMAKQLPEYCLELGFTHVEFMPIMEYPYDPSWGYQITGYFAPTSRFGSPEEFKVLVDALHQAGIGVLLDWVPSHFPADNHGLGNFDGTCVYEHPDLKKGYHPDWKSLIFNYGRPEIRSFLISNALFWLDQYHADGLRVDAVASMLYLDYSRNNGEWEPNEYGGRDNLDAIGFMKDLNVAVYGNYPDVQTIAEESTAYPMVTKPVFAGGLGFGQKWMMGWMHDALHFFSKDPVHRKFHQFDITNSLNYAFTENFTLPISHDEVVYGKKSLLDKMPGDEWQKFANLRLFLSFMYAHPGSKLLFMGSEFGQWKEWNFAGSLDWHLTDFAPHKGIQTLVSQLNAVYKSNSAFYAKAYSHEGFEWIDFNDHQNSVLSFIRKDPASGKQVLAIFNFTPTVQQHYRIGASKAGNWQLTFNSDAANYWGSNIPIHTEYSTEAVAWQGRTDSLIFTLPPLAALFLEPKI